MTPADSGWRHLLFGALALAASVTYAQVVPSSRAEVEVHSADGGLFVSPSGEAAPDGGTAQVQLIPPALLKESPAPYPEQLASRRVGGEVALQLLVDEAGAVAEVAVEASPDPSLTAAAVQAARGLRFSPARLGGAPTAVRLHYTYRFEPPPPPPPSGTVAGVVRSRGTRNPIPGAALLDEQEKKLGESDAQGRFEISVAPGAHAIRVRAPGYEAGRFEERVSDGQRLEVVYRLEPTVIDPYVTVVRDERIRTEVSRITLQDQELREVPGTQGDPFRVVMLLPGVASVASGVSYPVVRGSQPAATGYFIDGVQVPQLFHLFLGPAVVHPDFIDQIDFYPGAAPAKYGRLLGGVVDGQAARPHEDRVHASAYADLINAGAFLEVPIAQTGTSVTLSGRFSYTAWLLAQLVSVTSLRGQDPSQQTRAIADFWDYQGRIEQKLGEGKLRLLALGSSDLIGTDTPSAQALNMAASTWFHRIDLRYRQDLRLGKIELGATWGVERDGIDGTRGDLSLGAYELLSHKLAARALWEKDVSAAVALAAGADATQERAVTTITGLSPISGGEAQAFQYPLTIGTFTGAWVQAVWRPDADWTITPGLRADDYHLVPGIDRIGVDPRLTVRYRVHDWLTLKSGAAMVHQPPTVLLNLPVMDISGLRYGLQEAWVVDAGAEVKPAPGYEVNFDLYYDRLNRAYEFDLMRILQDSRRLGVLSPSLGTTGESWGIELMLRHPLGGNWFGWISYSYGHSTRWTKYVRTDPSYEVTGILNSELPFAFDETHVVNASVSYKFPYGVTAGVTAHFNTGRPESGQITSRTAYEWTDPETGQLTWRSADRDQLTRLPPFFRIDARLAKAWSWDDFRGEIYLDVMNALISQEILGYDYTADPATGALTKNPFEIPLFIPMLGFKASY